MLCTLTPEDDQNVLTVKGELGLPQAAQFKAKLIQALDTAQRIVIDLRAVTEMDLSSLQLLCAAHKSAVARGKQLSLGSNLPETITQQIQKAGIIDSHHCGRDSSDDCLWKGGSR